MIAAEKDRRCSRSRQLVSPRTEFPGPALDFPVMLRIVRRKVRWFGDLANRDIAMIAYFARQSAEHVQKTGCSQGRRSHQGSTLRCADINGRTEQHNSACLIRFDGLD